MTKLRVGVVVGRLTLVKKDGAYWWCRCACLGTMAKRVHASSLSSARIRSCGCLRRETTAALGERKRQ